MLAGLEYMQHDPKVHMVVAPTVAWWMGFWCKDDLTCLRDLLMEAAAL